MTPELRDRVILAEQRSAIVGKLEDAALFMMTEGGDEEHALVAAVLRQAAEIARWTPYDPPAEVTP